MDGDFWRGEVETYSIPARLKVDQGFEVRVVHRPVGRREAAEMVVNRNRAVQRSSIGFTNVPRDEEYLLIDPCVLGNGCHARCKKRGPDDRARGAWRGWRGQSTHAIALQRVSIGSLGVIGKRCRPVGVAIGVGGQVLGCRCGCCC